MTYTNSVGINITDFLVFFESTMRALPNDTILIGPKITDGLAMTNIVADSIMSGSDEVGIYTGSLSATDVTELFTTPVTGVDPLTINKVGSKWEVISSSLVPANMAENLSGISTRTTLKGLGELVSGIVSGDGVGTQVCQGILIDQVNSRGVLLNDGVKINLTDMNSVGTRKGWFEGIVAQSQGFFEAA